MLTRTGERDAWPQDMDRLFAIFAMAASLRVTPDGDAYSFLIAQTSRTEDYALLRKVCLEAPGARKGVGETEIDLMAKGHCARGVAGGVDARTGGAAHRLRLRAADQVCPGKGPGPRSRFVQVRDGRGEGSC